MRDIASAKVDRGTAVAVMREGDRHIGEDAEDDGDQEGRCTDTDTDGNECCIEGADACRDTGEGVVNVGVEEQDDEAGNEPTKAERGNRRARTVGDPCDDARFCKSRSERHQRAHPEHCVPCALFLDDILPVDDVEHQHEADRAHGNGRRVDVRETRACPECERDYEDDGKTLFRKDHWTHFGKLALCQTLGVGNMHELRRRKFHHDIGNEEKRDESRHDGGARPTHPCDMDAQRLFGERHAERVARHRGHEHRAGHGIRMVADLHEVCADTACALTGF